MSWKNLLVSASPVASLDILSQSHHSPTFEGPTWGNENMNFMQLVALSASNIWSEGITLFNVSMVYGFVSKSCAVHYWPYILRHLSVQWLHLSVYKLLIRYDRKLNQLPYTFNCHIRHIRPSFMYAVYFLYIRYTVYRIHTGGPALHIWYATYVIYIQAILAHATYAYHCIILLWQQWVAKAKTRMSQLITKEHLPTLSIFVS